MTTNIYKKKIYDHFNIKGRNLNNKLINYTNFSDYKNESKIEEKNNQSSEFTFKIKDSKEEALNQINSISYISNNNRKDLKTTNNCKTKNNSINNHLFIQDNKFMNEILIPKKNKIYRTLEERKKNKTNNNYNLYKSLIPGNYNVFNQIFRINSYNNLLFNKFNRAKFNNSINLNNICQNPNQNGIYKRMLVNNQNENNNSNDIIKLNTERNYIKNNNINVINSSFIKNIPYRKISNFPRNDSNSLLLNKRINKNAIFSNHKNNNIFIMPNNFSFSLSLNGLQYKSKINMNKQNSINKLI